MKEQQPTPQADGTADVTPEHAERYRALLADIAGPASLPVTLANVQRTVAALGGVTVAPQRIRSRRENH